VKIEERIKPDKIENIIDAAQRRFSLYGLEKTSMREIANDLHISKASLYYYFPDKENLYLSVIGREQSEFIRIIKEELISIDDPAECLRMYALKRLSYFRTLLNLGRLKIVEIYGLKPVLASTLARFREEETMLVTKVLDTGNQTGLFIIDNTYKVAALFLDLLRGLRISFMTNKEFSVMDESEYESLSEKVGDITDIFINGLMCNTTNTYKNNQSNK
jgi:AcrR family transcriptional regulator